MSFYAVAKGRQVGIYTTWSDCKINTDGYPKPVFKKFSTKEEAEKFITDNSSKVETPNLSVAIAKSKPAKKIDKIDESNFEADYFVYTDGSCSNNGKVDAMAGIGIYFGENDTRNVSQRVHGKQSNNTAELGAILHLYDIIEKDINAGKKIAIVSDSEYAIRCATTYGLKCADEGWKKDIPNKDVVKKIYELYNDRPNVKFLHVMAHTEKSDVHSIGNDGADKLANNAIGLDECPYKDKNTRIYLEVPFIKKDIVKGLDGRWDVSKRLWYILSDSNKKEQALALFKPAINI